MNLPVYVDEALKKLHFAGFEAYVVGGCVRNSLLGITPHDYDITTSAVPNEIKQVFSDYRVIETGIKHGTVTVLINAIPLEITTYRIDGDYTDHRRPDTISFTRSLEKDLARRDFTVNALAFAPEIGLIDLCGGENDLRCKRLRCVGEAELRFEEDALRILRALRFMAVYGFKAEKNTDNALHRCKELLTSISPERTANELNRLLVAEPKSLERVLFDYADIFSVIIPEIAPCVGFMQNTHFHDRDVWSHIIGTVAASPSILPLRLTMLFHDLGKPQCYQEWDGEGHFKGHGAISAEIANETLSRLRYDNKTREEVIFLVKRHDMPMDDNPQNIKRQLAKYGVERYFALLDVHIADDCAKAPEYRGRIAAYQNAKKIAAEFVAQNQCFSLKNLALDGNDIKRMGFSGKDIGDALELLLNAVIDEKCKNEKKSLQKYLELYRKK